MRHSALLRAVGALAASTLAACGGDSTGPGPAPTLTQRLDIIAASSPLPGLSGKSLAIAPGDSARLSAIVNLSNGTSTAANGLSWTATDSSVAAVDAAGLVRARKIGTTTLIARASALADTVMVTVSLCGSAQTVALAVGQAQQYGASQGTSLCITTTTAGEEYAIVAFNADLDSTRATNDVRASVRLTATGIGTASAAVSETESHSAGLLDAATPSLSRRAFETDAVFGGVDTRRRDVSFDLALRRTATRVLRPRMAAARATIQAAGTARRSTAALAAAAIGEIVTLNAGLEPCDTSRTGGLNRRKGRVVAISNRAIIVADTLNPAGGFTDAEYSAFATAFDTLAYPVNVANFGTETDIDKNGKSIIFFTSAVNAMTPRNASYYVGGFFYERDLFQNSNPRGADYCAASNVAEMFYMLVPDPRGTINGNVFTKTFVSNVTVGTLAHEFQHLINAGRRLHVNKTDEWETTWLNEGLSHVAEELVFYRAAGLSPRTPRLDAASITASSLVRNAFNTYNGTQGNIGRLLSYFDASETSSPYADNDELETRGATWLFLRYAADRLNGNDLTLWQKLVATTKLSGLPNLQAALGVNAATLADWFRDWTVASYVDGLAGGTLDARFTYRSYSFRSVIGGLKLSNGQPAYPTYPLTAHPLEESTPLTAAVRPGAAAYYRMTVPAGRQARLAAAGASGNALPATFRITVARIK